jgi:hypothetical protein
MLKELPEADAVPAGLYSKAYLSSQFNSKVGPGGYPCEGFNQPLLWYPISMDPPPDHPWAGPDWDSLTLKVGTAAAGGEQEEAALERFDRLAPRPSARCSSLPSAEGAPRSDPG